jgi:serine protease Do
MLSNTFKRNLVALAIVASFGAGAVVADRVGLVPAIAAVTPAAVTIPVAQNPVGLPDFSDLVANAGAAVVHISTAQDQEKVSTRMPRGMPDLEDMFPGLPPGLRGFPTPRTPDDGPMRGVGSGFIVSPDGVILTNAHVVAGADEVTVRLTDKREFKAKVLGRDKMTDVAVLKIDARNLPSVKIGNPDATRVGEWVVAIGAPYGFDNTVTSGIVSAKARSLPGDAAVGFIQTDAAVNPGNSGGPLFNMKGEVIGITSQIFSRSGGFQGLAFAVPINAAMNVKDQLQRTGKVEHGRLGVSVQEVNQSLAENFGLPQPQGALIASLQKDSPALKAGLQPGDVILKFDGKPISRSGELPPMVAAVTPGTSVPLEIWRDGKTRTVHVTVGNSGEKSTVASTARDSAPSGKLGISVRPLSAEEKRSGDYAGGVVVEDVAGAAARAGIRPGDVIVSFNRTPVTSPEQLRELVAKAGKTAALLVQRDDATLFIPVPMG